MTGVTVLDQTSNGKLTPTLWGLLILLQVWASELLWSVTNLEAVGTGADRLYEIEASESAIPFEALLDLIEGVNQVIDGEFIGRSRTGAIMMTIRAVDSTAFDVEAFDPRVAELVESSFKQTRRFSTT